MSGGRGYGTDHRGELAPSPAHPATHGVPVIVETPSKGAGGTGATGHAGSAGAAGHAGDIATLRRLA
jgi:hypothetical protein